MVILPMDIKGMIVHLQVSQKNILKKENYLLSYSETNYMGEFEVNRTAYFGTDISKEQRAAMEQYLKIHPEVLTEFIRKNIQFDNNYIYVLSRNYKQRDFCTRYQVPIPPKQGNKTIDKLYGKLLNDLRLDTNNHPEDTFLSFRAIGLTELLSNSQEMIVHEGIDVLEYFEQLNFDTLNESSDLRIQKSIQKRPKKFAKIYQEIAENNTKIYKQIYKLHHQVYATKPSWPKFTEQQKVYIKRFIDQRKG